MKSIKSTRVLLLSLLVLGGCATTPTKSSLTPPRGEEAEFRQLVTSCFQAWSFGEGQANRVLPAVAKFYAPDPGLVIFDVAPLKYTGWSDYATGVTTAFLDLARSNVITPHDDLVVNRRGNLAWTTVTYHLNAELKDGTSLSLEGRQTAIWEWRDGHWLIVHEHASAPLQP